MSVHSNPTNGGKKEVCVGLSISVDLSPVIVYVYELTYITSHYVICGTLKIPY